MSHLFRSTVARLSPAPRPRPARARGAEARAAHRFRVARLPLTLLFAGAIAGAALAALQLDSLQNDHVPALRDAELLGETAAVMGVALRDADLSRADRMADRFHAVATTDRGSASRRAEMLTYDASFGDYYVSARRAAQGTSMTDEADLSSAESAKLAKGVLTERLDAGIATDTALVDGSSTALLKFGIAIGLLLALGAGVALYLLLPHASDSQEPTGDVLIKHRAEEAMAQEGRVEHDHLQEAVRRMSERRQAVMHASAQVAERNRQQVALLQVALLQGQQVTPRPEKKAGPTLTLLRNEPMVLRTPLHATYQLGKHVAAGV